MLTYRTALVTGASSGMGRGLAVRLAGGGTEVVLAARREAELDSALVEIAKAGGKARKLVLDVADTTATVAAIRKLDEELGGLDLIVANAGIGAESGRKKRFTWEGQAASAHVNFCGAIATLSAVLPQMVERGRGHIAGVASLAAFGALPGSAAYCASKAGLAMWIEAIRIDLRGTGVTATCIYPGFVKTPMTEKARNPMPQLMELESAIDAIMDELPHEPASIEFPQPLAFVARLGARLPRSLREAILSKQKQ